MPGYDDSFNVDGSVSKYSSYHEPVKPSPEKAPASPDIAETAGKTNQTWTGWLYKSASATGSLLMGSVNFVGSAHSTVKNWSDDTSKIREHSEKIKAYEDRKRALEEKKFSGKKLSKGQKKRVRKKVKVVEGHIQKARSEEHGAKVQRISNATQGAFDTTIKFCTFANLLSSGAVALSSAAWQGNVRNIVSAASQLKEISEIGKASMESLNITYGYLAGKIGLYEAAKQVAASQLALHAHDISADAAQEITEAAISEDVLRALSESMSHHTNELRESTSSIVKEVVSNEVQKYFEKNIVDAADQSVKVGAEIYNVGKQALGQTTHTEPLKCSATRIDY